MPWTFLGEGAFNQTYRNGNLIFKVAKENSTSTQFNPADVMDNYARSVRIWNEINSNLHPPAYIHTTKIDGNTVTGWVCPFVDGVQASDEEISQKLIDIYNKTGRVIFDADVPENFIKTPAGEIICIDIGLALQLELRDTSQLIGLQRKSSFSSLDSWYDMQSASTEWLENQVDRIEYRPDLKQASKTEKTIHALLFIKLHRPDIVDVSFLNNNPQYLDVLAHAYDLENPINAKSFSEEDKKLGVHQAETLLSKQKDLSLEAIKQYCRSKLTQAFKPINQISAEEQEVNTQYALELLKKINRSETEAELLHICNTIEALENNPKKSSQTSPFIPINPDSPAIHQLHQYLFIEFAKQENLHTIKHNCLTILFQFINQYGHMEPKELEELKTQMFHSPKDKIQFYKTQMENQKLSDLEKHVIKLIKEIENAATLEEIDEFILKFENAQPPRSSKSPQTVIDYFTSYFRRPSPEEELDKSLSKCKIAIASAKLTLDNKLLEQNNAIRGQDLM